MKLFLIKPTESLENSNSIFMFAQNEQSAVQNVISKNTFNEMSNNIIIREIDINKTQLLDVKSDSLVFKTNQRQYIDGMPNIRQIKLWLNPSNKTSKVIEVSKDLEIEEINKLLKEEIQEMINYDWRYLD